MKKRCSDALTDLRSPYIEDFLMRVDYELYIQHLRKQRKNNKVLGFIHQIIDQGNGVESVLPNQFENGTFKTGELNFY